MRLIDADALNGYILTAEVGKVYRFCFPCKEIQQAIDEQPIIEERKTGNWKWGFADNGWADWTCSECGWTENNDIHVSLGYKYCPHCGAYMEGVISDEEKNKRYMESFEKEESDEN